MKMEFHFLLSFPVTALAAVFALLLSIYHCLRILTSSQRAGILAPEAGGAWPLIGHLRMLGGPELPHITLASLAERHGPIFGIRLGMRRAVVVSNWEIAKECFSGTNDKVFSTRPRVIAIDLMGYNTTMFGFASYGPYWREMRKVATLELLSNHRLTTFKPIHELEVKSSISKIYHNYWDKNGDNCKAVVVKMNGWLEMLTHNVISRIVMGKRVEDTDEGTASSGSDYRWQKALRECFELTGVFTVGDALPFLRWLDIGGYEKVMKKTARELDLVLQECLDQHKQRKASGLDKEEQDFMDVMLSLSGSLADEFGLDADTINKATCLNLILAASDSTMGTLTWALALLVNNRHALKKAQEEIEEHVGNERQVTESDINKLVYLRAIIKETLRLYPPTLLSPPREAMDDCIVSGYHVPARALLFLNLWKIHRDPRVWSDPLEFQPERFLTTHKDMDVRGQNFELLPFGSGRRSCPGIIFAFQVIGLALASLLHCFDFENPSADESIDMTPKFGLTNHNATPLKLLLTPRLSAHLYAS